MSRVKRVLEEETKATVWTTVQDPAFTGANLQKDVLPQTRNQRLLVDPPYDLSDPTTGVRLRWTLTDSLLQKLVRQKVDPREWCSSRSTPTRCTPAVRGMMLFRRVRSGVPAACSRRATPAARRGR